MFKTRAEKIRAEDRWIDSISPIGADPFNLAVSYTSWAGAWLLMGLEQF
jgi:hypothetical protein